jgi:hypothetical protein
MIFKGFNFRINKNLIKLPSFDNEGNLMSYVKEENYVYFGKILKSETQQSVKTAYKNKETGEAIYAEIIPLKGHSLTNMAYGMNKQVYLMKDDKIYQAKMKD